MTKSILGKKWSIKASNDLLAAQLVQSMQISDFIAKLLVSRGITLDSAESFLNPKIRDLLPDIFHLKDMEKGVLRVIEAIKSNESICILGDYDVDGATSSALLKRFFSSLGKDIKIYIPDRIKEGYGPSVDIIQKLKKDSVSLVITVDCGIMAFDALEYAKSQNIDVIVLDHHISSESLPDAIAVINPNRLDETTNYTYLAAVGVSFLFIIAVTSVLKKANFFTQKSEPNLIEYLDIVALGTVCDVVPLIGLNRAFVTQGLKIMSKRTNLGIKTLADLCNLNTVPNCYHLGFVMGPRINAGGRVGESNLGALLLSTNCEVEARKIAINLDKYNTERKDIEGRMLEEAMQNAEKQNANHILLIAKEGWHPGIIGIIASRIKEKYNKPTAIVAINNGIGKGSCRSVKGINFGAKVVDAKIHGLLEDGGGHAMAAGFSITEDKICTFHDFLLRETKEDYDNFLLNYSSEYDIEITTSAVNMGLAKQIQRLAPFGTGNHEPIIKIDGLFALKANIVGENHINILLAPIKNAYGNQAIRAIAFNAASNDLGQLLLSKKSGKLSVIGYLQVNIWEDKENLQMVVLDIIPHP